MILFMRRDPGGHIPDAVKIIFFIRLSSQHDMSIMVGSNVPPIIPIFFIVIRILSVRDSFAECALLFWQNDLTFLLVLCLFIKNNFLADYLYYLCVGTLSQNGSSSLPSSTAVLQNIQFN